MPPTKRPHMPLSARGAEPRTDGGGHPILIAFLPLALPLYVSSLWLRVGPCPGSLVWGCPMRRLPPAALWVLIVAFLGIPAYFAAHHNLAFYSALSRHGSPGTATVTSTDPDNHNTVCYRYVLESRQYHACDVAEDYEASQLSVGQSIGIVYDTRDPAVSCTCHNAKQQLASETVFATIMGVIILGFATLGAFGAARARRLAPTRSPAASTRVIGDGSVVPGAAGSAGLMSRQDARRIVEAAWSRKVSAAVVVVGATNLLFAVGLDVRTFFGGTGRGYEGAFVPSFILIFPLWGWAVLLMMALAGGTRRGTTSPMPRRSDVFGQLPRAVVALLAGTGVFAVACAAVGLPAITGGVPHQDPSTGQYTINNHGSATVVTRAAYEHAVAGTIRLFLGWTVLATALTVAVALNHCIVGRSRQHNLLFPSSR